MNLRTKMKHFTSLSSKKFQQHVMPHQLFAASLQALKKDFYQEHSNVTWEEFLTTKFGLWVDTRSNTDNTLGSSGRSAEKSGISLQIKKAVIVI